MFIKVRSAMTMGLLSFAAGVATGVLYAPTAGERTRRRLKRVGGELVDRAAEATESAADLVERTRDRVA